MRSYSLSSLDNRNGFVKGIEYQLDGQSKYFKSIIIIMLNITLFSGLKFKVEPHDLIVPQGHSVLLPCEGIVHQQHSRKIAKTGPAPVSVRWRGPDGQDIEIADTFRAQFPNGSLYITSLEADRGLTGSYQCVVSAEGIGTIVSRSARVSIASKFSPCTKIEYSYNY